MKPSFALVAVSAAIVLAGIVAVFTPEITSDVLLKGPTLFGIPLHTFFELSAVGLFIWIGNKLKRGVFFRMSLVMAISSLTSVFIAILLPSLSWLVPMIYAELNLLALGILATSIHKLEKK